MQEQAPPGSPWHGSQNPGPRCGSAQGALPYWVSQGSYSLPFCLVREVRVPAVFPGPDGNTDLRAELALSRDFTLAFRWCPRQGVCIPGLAILSSQELAPRAMCLASPVMLPGVLPAGYLLERRAELQP